MKWITPILDLLIDKISRKNNEEFEPVPIYVDLDYDYDPEDCDEDKEDKDSGNVIIIDL